MKTFIWTIIICFNVFSVILSYVLTNDMDKEKRIAVVCISEIINFILANLLYAITGWGIAAEVHAASKWMMLLTVLPINVIATSSLILKLFSRVGNNEIDEETFKHKLLFRAVALFIIFIIEIIYIKNIQIGISNMK